MTEAPAAPQPEGGVLALVKRFVSQHPIDAAQVIDRFSSDELSPLLATLPAGAAANLLLRVNPDLAARCLAGMAAAEGAERLGVMDPADAARLLARLDRGERQAFLDALPETRARELAEILSYPPDTAGHDMDVNVAQFKLETPVREALRWLGRTRGRRVTDVLVTDADGVFQGVVRLQDLVGASRDAALSTLIDAQAPFVHPMAPREEVVELINNRRLMSVPVVDSERRVVGMIRYAALLEAAQETAAEDVQRMFGVSAAEAALSAPLVGVRSRLPWLNINLLTAFAAAFVVGLFEDTLARFTALAVLLPVVAGQSGNTGAQALAVTMRGLALREIRTSHAWRVLRKELLVGAINGLAIASVTALGTYLWSRNPGLSLVMFLAMIASMVIASLSGAAVPIVLARLGRDPAVASSIILTTVTDIAGFVSFLGLATLLAHRLAGT